MKTVGVSAGAAAVGGGATNAGLSPIGSARAGVLDDTFDWATDGAVDVVFSPPTLLTAAGTPGLAAGWVLAGKISDWLGGTNDSPTAGDVSFHQTTTNAFMGWKEISAVHIGNQLENAQMMADIDARAAIADAWEDGKTESEASQAALDAIDDYHSVLWRNTFVSKQANALQIAYVIQTAANTTDADYSNWTDIGPTPANADYTGSGSIVDGGTQISPNTTQTDITLPNGETPTLEVVEFSAEWDNGDTWSSLMDNSFLDGYDSASGEFTFSTDQGYEFTDDFTAANLSVPDADLPSKRILNCADLADALNRIEQNATDLKQNYDLDRVGQIYTALDNGDVTPNEIRGVAGLAGHLSGTSDASAGRYQIALSTVTGVPRPDLSQVATVTIEHTGATDIEISVDSDGTRRRELTGTVTDQVYQGQIFASSISQDLTVDGTYLAGPVTVVLTGDALYRLDADGSVAWEHVQTWENGYTAVDVSPDGRRIYVVADGRIAAISATGTKLWEIDRPNDHHESVHAPDNESLYVGTRPGNLLRINPSDGSIEWTEGVHSDTVNGITSHNGALYTASDDQSIGSVNPDGSVNWTDSALSGAGNDIAISPDGSFAVVGTNNGLDTAAEVRKYDLENRTTEWTISRSGIVYSVEIANGLVYYSTQSTVAAVTPENTEQWSESYTDGYLAALPDSSGVIVGDVDRDAHELDPDSGGSAWSNSFADGSNGTTNGIATNGVDNQYDGLFYDAQFSAATEDGMSQLYLNGETKILEMKDADGNSVNNVNVDDFGPPQYDNADISEWSDYMAKISDEQASALDELADSDPIFGGGGGLGGFNIPTLPGFGVIETAIIVGGGYLGLSALSN